MIDRRALLAAGALLPLAGCIGRSGVLDVRTAGARGDGKALDHHAINAAIADLARAGGGTLHLPAGRYLCFSIRLMSNITLMLGEGAVIEAADPKLHGGSYDPPEDNPHATYQDFGHSYWQNSLIWGDGVENVAILGPGMIDGKGLTRNGPGAPWNKAGGSPVSMGPPSARPPVDPRPARERMLGIGNKAIALKNARNVRLEDFTIFKGGHFAILATGVDRMTIARLRIDTDRDGMDIDCCRDVRILGCKVNSPNDDAIVLKASLALGEPRATERVTIRDCAVSGFDLGTMLDGTRGRTQQLAPDRDGMTGRIKLGTESNGGFRGITIADCSFERSRGLALETVDGGVLEDVHVRNLVMREVTTAPIFLRTGDRRRGPEGTAVGKIRGVSITNVTATGIDPHFPATIAGLPDSPVSDVTLAGIHLTYAGGGTADQAAREIPEMRDSYPEPSMFGTLPAHGLYVRHARGIRFDGLEIATDTPDARPPIVIDRAEDITIRGLKATGKAVIHGSRNIVIRE